MIGAFALTSENCTHLSFELDWTCAWFDFNAEVSCKKDWVALNSLYYRFKALTFEHWIVSVLQFINNLPVKGSAVFAAETVLRTSLGVPHTLV
jgi:hypothetical protein